MDRVFEVRKLDILDCEGDKSLIPYYWMDIPLKIKVNDLRYILDELLDVDEKDRPPGEFERVCSEIEHLLKKENSISCKWCFHWGHNSGHLSTAGI